MTTTSSGPDFRDIALHPPTSAAVATEALTNSGDDGGGWDAHKVYFNERESHLSKAKGDEFDEFFENSNDNIKTEQNEVATAVVTSALEKMRQSDDDKREEDATLDPLGWPRQQTGLETTSTCTTGAKPDGSGCRHFLDGANPATSTRSFEEEDDAADLLQHRSDYYSEDDDDDKNGDKQELGEEAGFEVLATANSSGAMTMKDVTVLAPKVVLSKQKRIEMYESRGVDEDSSVEDEVEDDDWDEGRDVDYVMKPAETEDETDDDEKSDKNNGTGTSIGNIDKKDFKTKKAKYAGVPSEPSAVEGFASFGPAADAANLASSPTPPSPSTKSKKSGFSLKGLIKSPSRSSSKNKKSELTKKRDGLTKSTGPIPLLRPPPEEKLKQWEESKERAKKYLEESDNNVRSSNNEA